MWSGTWIEVENSSEYSRVHQGGRNPSSAAAPLAGSERSSGVARPYLSKNGGSRFRKGARSAVWVTRVTFWRDRECKGLVWTVLILCHCYCRTKICSVLFILRDVLIFYAIFFMLELGRTLFLHVIISRQTEYLDGISFPCVKVGINQMVGSNAWFHQFSKNKPLIGVIISHEILPRIFALPGSFQFSATLFYWVLFFSFGYFESRFVVSTVQETF